VEGRRDRRSDLQADLGEADGIEIVLRAVELTPGGVDVHLYARRSALTDALDEAYRIAFEAWETPAIAAARRGEPPPDPPTQPGTMLNAIDLRLHDDADTSYRRLGSQAAGTGTEWDAVWRFGPRPPRGATRLTVSIPGAPGDGYAQLI
jgi:hypothetical protein